jgi:hypothetical protein
MVTDQPVNTATFIDFLRRLLVNAERPIYLALDGHPVHGAKKVRDFVEAQAGSLNRLLSCSSCRRTRLS